MSQHGKTAVRSFWEAGSCGEVYALGQDLKAQLNQQAATRYVLEPYLQPFAGFESGQGKDVLEIGVGMGADHLEWAKSHPRSLKGIDLTERAAEWTRKRFVAHGFTPDVQQADAENLPFEDDSFDIVYSWGVIHCSPDTERCLREIHRVLRPGGTARVMIYARWSMVGYMLWLRYALLAGKPWRTLTDIYAHHLESPGTKCYSVREAYQMCSGFSSVEVSKILGPGDLLEGEVGQQHRGLLLTVAKRFYPRWLVRTLFRNHGNAILIKLKK